LEEQISEAKQKTWNGLHVYAIDGIELILTKSKNILDAGYSGRKISKYRESYFPKMFTTVTYDVLTGIVKDLRENPTLNEIADAISMVAGLEDNSLTLYDRLYACRKLIITHNSSHNYFLFRLRTSCLKEFRKIFYSRRRRRTVVVDGVTIQLIKINLPNGKSMCFATNLPSKLVSEKRIMNLYTLRWEVENAFRDFTQTIRLEQWHSKSINGLRQELFVALILFNLTKLKLAEHMGSAEKCMEPIYKKPNFKLLFAWVAENIDRIMMKMRGVWKTFVELIYKTFEIRKRYSRSYKREIKSPQSPFPYNNTVWYGLN